MNGDIPKNEILLIKLRILFKPLNGKEITVFAPVIIPLTIVFTTSKNPSRIPLKISPPLVNTSTILFLTLLKNSPILEINFPIVFINPFKKFPILLIKGTNIGFNKLLTKLSTVSNIRSIICKTLSKISTMIGPTLSKNEAKAFNITGTTFSITSNIATNAPAKATTAINANGLEPRIIAAAVSAVTASITLPITTPIVASISVALIPFSVIVTIKSLITVITATIPRNITTNPAKPSRSIIFAATAKPITATDSNPKVLTIIRARSPIEVPVSCITVIRLAIPNNTVEIPTKTTPIANNGPVTVPSTLCNNTNTRTTDPKAKTIVAIVPILSFRLVKNSFILVNSFPTFSPHSVSFFTHSSFRLGSTIPTFSVTSELLPPEDSLISFISSNPANCLLASFIDFAVLAALFEVLANRSIFPPDNAFTKTLI